MRRATWAVCGSTHAEQPRSNGFAVVANIVSHIGLGRIAILIYLEMTPLIACSPETKHPSC